jgi:hypothetical protein
MSDLPRGLIQFSQACLPPLFPGDYKIRVDQTIEEIRPEKPFQSELDFSVAGPRFDLNPADVYSVYPPANQSGEFGNTLPQIVFTRRTVPWERTIDGSDPDNQNPCPWLALMVLSASDFPAGKLPKIITRKVGELITTAEDDNCTGPALQKADLEDYESENDLCNTIDLPADLFSKVAPQQADLPYLAHVRTVSTDNKETLSYQTEGSFAVVLANRMPQAGTAGAVKNAVYLVSLEGFHNHLPAAGGSQKIASANVRLAVLAHWEFYCFGKNNFKVLMNNLATDRLQRPAGPKMRDSMAAGDEAARQVGAAFELGYTALNHHIRNGEKTVSWYRGPLVPMFYPTAETYPFLPSADKALRYNYNTGMLDASYAAAWQLGRLLALQNQQFAQALYRYRNQARLETKAAIDDADMFRAFRHLDADPEDKAVKVLNLENEAIAVLKSDAVQTVLGEE